MRTAWSLCLLVSPPLLHSLHHHAPSLPPFPPPAFHSINTYLFRIYIIPLSLPPALCLLFLKTAPSPREKTSTPVCLYTHCTLLRNSLLTAHFCSKGKPFLHSWLLVPHRRIPAFLRPRVPTSTNQYQSPRTPSLISHLSSPPSSSELFTVNSSPSYSLQCPPPGTTTPPSSLSHPTPPSPIPTVFTPGPPSSPTTSYIDSDQVAPTCTSLRSRM